MLAKLNRRSVPAYWDDFFNDSFFHHASGWNRSAPAVNVAEDEESFRIELAVPGMSKKDFRIDLERDVLTVSSEQKDGKKENQRNYTRREFRTYSFSRSFQLPESVDVEKIKARHEAGVLSIELPKKEEMVQKAPKQIEVDG